MTAQVLFFNDFSEKDPHLNAVEQMFWPHTFSTKPHTSFMHFLSRRSRIVMKNLFKNTLQRISVSMEIFIHEKTFRCWIINFRKVFGETYRNRGLLSKRQTQEPLQNIGWSTLNIIIFFFFNIFWRYWEHL